MDKYHKFAELLLGSRYAVALTGAGISVESGIPDFRSDEGVWARYDPLEYGHIDSFQADPAKVWNLLKEMDAMVESVGPNDAHYALGELEKLGVLKMVITQNVDSLHQKGGANNVVEFHGSFRTMHCNDCLKSFHRREVSLVELPPRCTCGGPIRPDVVLFGEGIPDEAYSRAFDGASRCDLMVVVGTSASVAPASDLPLIARRRGARIVEINPEASELPRSVTEMHIMAPAGAAFRNIMKIVKSMQTEGKN
ncbi:MAG: NAD-dependent deacylase [Syntrophobacteraceae bacterium]|nr:NAD-dependent deacylase [Syntrophobacteraceae bacterium]